MSRAAFVETVPPMNYDVIIVGGGPAGSSAAITLTQSGLRVLVLEAKQMPREKLCGEFITPESFQTLRRLGVMDQIVAAGAQEIRTLGLNDSTGRQVTAPISDLSRGSEFALSLTRARFDQILFDRAREVGACCKESFAVKRCLFRDGLPCGVEATGLVDGRSHSFEAAVVIDASGRNSRLTVEREERIGGRPGSRLYAFKAHFAGAEDIRDQVELYFFQRGYGGLSRVEGGLANLCFIAHERVVRETEGDIDEILRRTVMQNPLARRRLAGSERIGKWHSVGPLTFGHRRLSRERIIAIGDASGMIDPFTGTGIQVALRTGELAARALLEAIGGVRSADAHGTSFGDSEKRAGVGSQSAAPSLGSAGEKTIESALLRYHDYYVREFGKRMRASGILRGAAFYPRVSNMLGAILARSPGLTRRILRATRSAVSRDY